MGGGPKAWETAGQSYRPRKRHVPNNISGDRRRRHRLPPFSLPLFRSCSGSELDHNVI